MSHNRSITCILLATIAAAPVAAVAGDEAVDESLVVARTVMPRVAYHALEPTANPIRVQATVFPGRIFHGMLGDLAGHLAGDDELGERASLHAGGPTLRPEPMFGPTGPAPAEHVPVPGASGRSTGASVGGVVLRATSGIGDRISQTIIRATGQGSGP